MVRTVGGLLVPADALPAGQRPQEPFQRDADGRRRIVLTRDARKALNRAILILKAANLGIVVGCRGECGQALRPEGEGGPDHGYGCQCSRVHFQ